MARPLRPSDPLVVDLIRLARSKAYRHSKSKAVVSGTKLVTDLGQRYHFKELLSKNVHDPALKGLRTESLHVGEIRSLRRIADLKSFDGLIGTLDLPGPTRDFGDPRLVLCLDYVSDPGLLGTLLRSAMAFEWQAAFFLPQCVDPWHPLCIRASQGALFELPYMKGNYTDLLQLCKKKGLQFSVSHSGGVDIGSTAYKPPAKGVALLLREEYSSPWSPPKAATKIKVPSPWPAMNSDVGTTITDEGQGDKFTFEPRSLDVAVAGGILMHHIKHYHFPQVARSPYVASPKPSA